MKFKENQVKITFPFKGSIHVILLHLLIENNGRVS